MEHVILVASLLILGFGCLYLAVKLDSVATKLRVAQGQIEWFERRVEVLTNHLNETKAALQLALGGGWQLASPDRDVFLLPESAVLDFSDTLSGGVREQYRRSARVSLLLDDDLWRRITRADSSHIPLAFRGLEWRITEVGYPQGGGPGRFREDHYGMTLNLETYASGNR
jgi:hypothetical protein